MKLNKLIEGAALTVCMLAAGAAAQAQSPAADIKAAKPVVEKTDNNLIIKSQVDFSSLRDMKSDREIWLTPVIRSADGRDSLELSPLCVAGHNRYYLLQRTLKTRAERDRVFRAKKVSSLPVESVVDWQPWMETASLNYRVKECGCCEEPKALADIPVDVFDFVPKVFVPAWAYITPPPEKKVRSLSGSAYIDFPVNRTELYPDYRRNPEELASIRKTIDKVRDDADVTIKSLTVTGYASPEGSYKNNERLAAGRTATLIAYIRDQYAFDNRLLHESSVPEDWAGLIERLKLTDIANRDAIMNIAQDQSLAPDARDAKMRKDFPVQYAWILREIYPALRHSDYTIEYSVVDYTDPAQIGVLLKSAPQKLSLGEMFTYASTLEPESDEYREVFEVAVRMYPDNKIANLNAANSALRHSDFAAAERYLAKAGDGAEAQYVRGLSQALRGNYAEAKTYFDKASKLGFTKADEALVQMREKKFID